MAPAQSTTRKPREFSIAQLVQKKIHDNFRGFSTNEIDVKLVNGLTLRQTLERDLKAHSEGRAPFTLGPNYYNGLRSAFKSSTGAASALQVQDANAPVDAILMRAIAAAKRAHPDRTQISAWSKTVSDLNQSEMTGVCRFELSLKVRCQKQLACALDLLRMQVRIKVTLKFPHEWSVVKPWSDDVLDQSLARHRASKGKDEDFILANKLLLQLHMPAPDLDKVAKHDGPAAAVADSLIRLVGSSQVGTRLFSGAIKEVLASKVDKIVQDEIQRIFVDTATAITEDSLPGIMAEVCNKVEELPCLDMLPARRIVKVLYRAVQICIKVGGVGDYVTMAFWAAIKSVGVNRGVLVKLWVEDLLVPSGSNQAKYKATVTPELVSSAAMARKALKAKVDDSNAATGDMILQVADKACAALSLTDSSFRIEYAIIEELTKDTSGTRTQSAMLKCLPTTTTTLKPEDSSAQLRALAVSDCMKLADQASQQRLKQVSSWVTSISQGLQPAFGDAMANPIMAKIVDACAFFLVVPAAGSRATQRGKAAIEPLLKQATEMKEGLTPEKIQWATTFSWLLSPEQHTRARDLAKTSQARAGATLESSLRKRARAPKAKARPAAANNIDEDRAMAEAMNFFS